MDDIDDVADERAEAAATAECARTEAAEFDKAVVEEPLVAGSSADVAPEPTDAEE